MKCSSLCHKETITGYMEYGSKEISFKAFCTIG